jgi:hypothetical protein
VVHVSIGRGVVFKNTCLYDVIIFVSTAGKHLLSISFSAIDDLLQPSAHPSSEHPHHSPRRSLRVNRLQSPVLSQALLHHHSRLRSLLLIPRANPQRSLTLKNKSAESIIPRSTLDIFRCKVAQDAGWSNERRKKNSACNICW